ncbi:GNAT family N-acetyltransferase [Herbaspirillum sp. LeCh32-8]|uniref:GNAT family N-acetyltransferase n=1 Tax=Herbaspirillum sp. LeCh32-8 TaxID=2821356 RepID=UPI001AE165C1|nr:GNAT family N-acetyltransferase [Herbaspirillum sp. LeCh32-8]MBP0596724.1 GNAT family N-acetyltransferase [Herbaspirillum sp. LeCh32-8]
MGTRLPDLTQTQWRIADAALRHADSDADKRACFPVMHELRPHLQDEDDFMQRIGRAADESYRILAAWEEGRVVALAGYRFQENLVYGKFLYVDDLVSAEGQRGKRWGERLLKAVDEVAAQAGVARVVLDTGMANTLAQRFYFRQGMLTGALRFGKPVGSAQ